MSRKVCVVTGTRADYGLLRWVMEGIKNDSALELQIIVTGMHLSPEFGLTYRDIEEDDFHIDSCVEMLLSSDTPSGLAKSMGLGMIGFGDALQQLQPNILLVLGDRFEIFSAVASALVAKIPVAHLHGGETTEGAFDDGFRHSITKMSHLHFVAAEVYRNRVIQMGEYSEHVFLVGGLGIDNIKKMNLLERSELENALDFRFNKKNLLITFHPVTLENTTSAQHMHELLSSLEKLEDTNLIFTMPNADSDSRILFDLIKSFVDKNKNARAYTSLGQLRYLSCMQYVDGVIGNSSSGLLEAPSFKIGTINIGDRQKGRLKAESIIDCESDEQSISNALSYLYSSEFQKKLNAVINPYGQGGASEEIVNVIKTYPLDNIIKKTFYDLSF